MRLSYRVMALIAVPLVLSPVYAWDFKSVGTGSSILYDTPSFKGRKLFIAPRDMPVEVVLTYGDWSKVRDVTGDLSWIESKQLVAKRTVVVIATSTKARVSADDAGVTSFLADKGVVLDFLESAGNGWIKVRHRDGQMGYIKVTDVWGE